MLGLAIGQAAGAAAGLGIEKIQQNMQYKQAQKLQDLQIQGQQEMGQFNQGLALDMWNKTNYEAQRQHMEKAGLNVGLMYGQGGGGGATTQTPTGQVSGQAAGSSNAAGMGLKAGADLAMQAAQIELLKAQTNKTNVEAEKTEGVDTEKGRAEIDNLRASTTNAGVQKTIMEYQAQVGQIEADIANRTEEDIIRTIRAEREKVEAEAISARTQGHIDQATEREIIRQSQLTSQKMEVELLMQKQLIKQSEAQTELTKEQVNMTKELSNKYIAEVTRMEQETKRDWAHLTNEEKDVITRRTLANFQTSTAAELKQWTDVLNGVTRSWGDVKPKQPGTSNHTHYH